MDIYDRKNRYIMIFWLAIITAISGLEASYTFDIIVSIVERIEGTTIILLLFSGVFGVGSDIIFVLLYFLFNRDL